MDWEKLHQKDPNTYAHWLETVLMDICEEVREKGDEISVVTTPKNLLKVIRFLRDNTNAQFKVLVDITAVDYAQREKRFTVVYLLLSLRYSTRLKVFVNVDPYEGLNTISSLYASANWFEREVWDMFGIYFHNHPDLRRLLTDYGFQGHPLRKDFPLTGYTEVRYDEEKKRVVCEPLETAQEFRAFNFQNSSPWKDNLQSTSTLILPLKK